MPNFNEEARYDAEVEPLLKALMDKCREIGLPMLTLVCFSRDDAKHDVGMIKAIPGNEVIATRVPAIMQVVYDAYTAISEADCQVTGIALMTEQEVMDGKNVPFPTWGKNSPYLN